MSRRTLKLRLLNKDLDDFLSGNRQPTLEAAAQLSETHNAVVVIMSGENNQCLATIEYATGGC